MSRPQQQLITRAWYEGPMSADFAPSRDVIGTVEGFLPQPQPFAPVDHYSLRPAQPRALNIREFCASVGVLLVGYATFLGLESRSTRQSPLVAVAATNNSLSDSPAPIADEEPAESLPSVADPPPVAPEAPIVSLRRPPDTMALDASAPPVSAPSPGIELRTPPRKPEVTLRVTVDGKGHALAFRYQRGDPKRMPAAREAARLWHFQPCVGSAPCKHLFKFTDLGDASIVHVIR